jgi:hypothetical protein
MENGHPNREKKKTYMRKDRAREKEVASTALGRKGTVIHR